MQTYFISPIYFHFSDSSGHKEMLSILGPARHFVTCLSQNPDKANEDADKHRYITQACDVHSQLKL